MIVVNVHNDVSKASVNCYIATLESKLLLQKCDLDTQECAQTLKQCKGVIPVNLSISVQIVKAL